MTDLAEAQPMELTESALRALVQRAPDGIFVANAEGRYVYVNDAGCRMLGYARHELIGKTIVDLIPAADIPKLAESRDRMLDGTIDVSEWVLRRKDGRWLPVEVSANILPDGQWHGIVRDISERRDHERERSLLFEDAEKERRWLKSVMDALPLGMILFDTQRRVSVNEHAQQLLGMTTEPGKGSEQYASRILYPDGRAVPPGELVSDRILRHGERVLGEEYLIERPDGSRIPILGSAVPIFDEECRIAGGVGVFQDVSERMRLEQAVRENERLLKAVFDMLPVGIWIADKSGRITSNNPAGEQIWRGTRYVPVSQYGEYKGWWADSGKLIAPEEWALARALTRGETSHAETVRIQCFDGTFKTIINSAAPLRDESGAITGAIVVNEDITALYEAQEKLRANERLFRTVFDLLPVGLWVADAEGKIVLVNPAGAGIWQGVRHVGPEEFGQYRGWWVETGKPVTADEWALTRAIRKGETSLSELLRIQCFDGSFKTVINWGAPIRNEAGKITGAVAVNEDITALYHAQEQLRAAVRDREDILAVVTHDLRNPLSGVLLAAMSVARKARALPGAQAIEATAAVIADATRRMSALVDDLLAVATAAAGHSILKLESVKAGALLASAQQAAQPLFARAGLELQVVPTGELPLIQVDINRILRVLANLLDNALKFTERGGTTLLEAQAVAGGVRFSVANSGASLSPEEMENMFQPFWQGGRKDRRGAGLGLSICRSIIEEHGGSVWAEPAAGMRVRVCFVLPRTQAAVASEGTA